MAKKKARELKEGSEMPAYILNPRHVLYLFNLNMDRRVFEIDIRQGHGPESADKILAIYEGILLAPDAEITIRTGLDDICRLCKDRRLGCEDVDEEDAAILEFIGLHLDTRYNIMDILSRRNENGA